ncbi:MAG: HNH endonuclease [bacterium]
MKFELKKYHRNTSDKDFIQDIKNVTQKIHKNTVTISEYSKHGKYHPSTITNRFGSWFTVLEKAGLAPSATKANVSDEKLFNNIREVWIHLERQPSCKDLKKPLSKYSNGPYYRRFGSWQKALEAFIKYINSSDTENTEKKNKVKNDKENYAKKSSNQRKTKRDISDRLRFSVLLRDGFRCQSCGSSPLTSPGTELHVDHIIPWSKGGETTPDNLQTKCKKCNLGKGNAFNR